MGQFIVVPLCNWCTLGRTRIQNVIEKKINAGIKQVQAHTNQTRKRLYNNRKKLTFETSKFCIRFV